MRVGNPDNEGLLPFGQGCFLPRHLYFYKENGRLKKMYTIQALEA